jgi:hypothetical protein
MPREGGASSIPRTPLGAKRVLTYGSVVTGSLAFAGDDAE